MNCDLNQLLSYTNERVQARYEKDYPNAKLSSAEALKELMKYIWLSQQHRQEKRAQPDNLELDFDCVIHEEMINIDYMWHTFLLFTKDYQAFCNNYLNGQFFHHEPLDENHKSNSIAEYESKLARYLSYIYDKLGEETVLKWFEMEPAA